MKKVYITTTAIILILLIVIIFFSKCITSNTISIKTEFGDQFSVLCDDFGDLYVINDVDSDFSTDLYYFSNEDQIHSVCDNQYIRCYRISDGREDGYKDKFIFKIKKYDEFFSVRYGDVKYSSEYMFKDDHQLQLKVLVCLKYGIIQTAEK